MAFSKILHFLSNRKRDQWNTEVLKDLDTKGLLFLLRKNVVTYESARENDKKIESLTERLEQILKKYVIRMRMQILHID